MVLLLFLIPLQPFPWQPGEGLRLWSQPGSLSAGADGGDQTGGPHWPGTLWDRDTHGGDPHPGPHDGCGAVVHRADGGLGCRDQQLQGPSISCCRRWDTSGGLEVETGLEEMSQGSLKMHMGPAPPCTTAMHTGKGFPYLPSLFSHCILFDISPGRAAGGRDKPALSCRQGLFKLLNEVLWVLAG